MDVNLPEPSAATTMSGALGCAFAPKHTAHAKRSTDNVATLATAYYWQYERSAAGAVGSRPQQAIAWYNYLSGQPYNPISPAGYNSKPTLQTPFSFGNMRLLYIYLLIMMLLGKKK